MSPSRWGFLLVSGTLVVSLLTGALLGAPSQQEAKEDSLYKHLAVFTEVLRLVRQAYVDETDLRSLMAGALEGSSDALDPFSMYIPEEQLDGYLDARAIGSARSGARVVKVRGAVYVISIQKGSPAETAELRRGDILTRIDGISTRGMPMWDIEQRLTRAPGTEIEIELLRRGETTSHTLVLGDFATPEPTLTEIDGTSVLTLPSFGEGTAAAVAALLANFEGDALVIDVRGVAWGDPQIAFGVAELFVEGALGSLVGQDGTLESFESRTPSWNGRLVVLIDRSSLGPAELLATVLKQGAGAQLVGQASFGFAGRPTFLDLDAGGALMITDAFYTGPDGAPLNESVVPDLRVSDRDLAFEAGEGALDDLILERGIELLRGETEVDLEKAA